MTVTNSQSDERQEKKGVKHTPEISDTLYYHHHTPPSSIASPENPDH